MMDVGLHQLVEIDYTGNVIRNIFSEPCSASRPALSLPHNSIFWYEVPSTIGVKKLSQSLSFFHTLSGEHVGGIHSTMVGRYTGPKGLDLCIVRRGTTHRVE